MTKNEKATLNKIRLPNDFWAFNFELTNTHGHFSRWTRVILFYCS